MPNHTITLNDEQFAVVADALEFTSRFLSGQIEESNLPAGLRFTDRYQSRRDSITQALGNLKYHLFPELGPGGHLGVGANTGESINRSSDILYEVYRTMLEHQTTLQKEAGEDVSHSVYARPGLNYTGLPKPKIAVDSKSASEGYDQGWNNATEAARKIAESEEWRDEPEGSLASDISYRIGQLTIESKSQ